MNKKYFKPYSIKQTNEGQQLFM